MNTINVQNAFLRKLWNTVFQGESVGLMSPMSLLHSEKSRVRHRANELVLIRQLERDIEAVRQGNKSINEQGRIVDLGFQPDRDSYNLPTLIDREGEEQQDYMGNSLSFSALNKMVQRDHLLQQVKRALTLRRIYIFAEASTNVVADERVSPVPVDPLWVARWRDAAQDSDSETMQLIWAKVISAEVKKPGRYSNRALEFLRGLSDREAEDLKIAARLSCGDFIFKYAKGYFSPQIHDPLFEKWEEWGLIQGYHLGHFSHHFESADKESYKAVIRCQNKAILVQHVDPEKELRLPVYRITLLGQMVFSLGTGEADTGYLFAISNQIKKFGFTVNLGDWISEGEGHSGIFNSKFEA